MPNTWGIVGSFNGWGGGSSDIVMTETAVGSNIFTAQFPYSGEFKFRYNNDWSLNYGSTTPFLSGPLDEYGANMNAPALHPSRYYNVTMNLNNKTYSASINVIKPAPTLSNFQIPTTMIAHMTIQLVPPDSNSTGAISYTSSDTNVATINGDIVSILQTTGQSIITAIQVETPLFTSGTITAILYASNYCFPKGTPILTDQGEIAIEKINPDIHTIQKKKIVGIIKSFNIDDYFVSFEKDSLGPNVPSQTTIISKYHGIFYKEKMKQAQYFVNKFKNVHKIKNNGELFYNILMEEHEKISVNNILCETMHPKNEMAQIYIKSQKLNENIISNL